MFLNSHWFKNDQPSKMKALIFKAKFTKLSGWIFMWCKNIPARKNSALSVENWQFWNFGQIFGDLAPLCPLLVLNQKTEWLGLHVV